MTRSLVFNDDFNRGDFGANWHSTSGRWKLNEGRVQVSKSRNKCLWLKRPIPADGEVEFDAWSMSPSGDIKFTIFGDGVAHETGYTLILGGWHNTISVIARMDEHGADRKERPHRGAVRAGKRYRFRMRRVDGRIDWFVDGAPYLSYDDATPLRGPGHDRFAFCNWETPLYFDNLKVFKLTERPAAPSGTKGAVRPRPTQKGPVAVPVPKQKGRGAPRRP